MTTPLTPKFQKASDFGLKRDRVPAANYTSHSVFEAERDKIFKRSWLYVCRDNEVADNGSYIMRELPTIRASVIIARGSDGVVRAFHNACAHRGVALVTEPCGKAETFRCPYHAWLYNNKGNLVAFPNAKDFPQIEKSEHGLAPLAIDCWNGFIFVHLETHPEQTLRNHLGAIADMFDRDMFDRCAHGFRMTQPIPCNWKAMVDAFSEGYHLPLLHKDTLGERLVSSANPFYEPYDQRLVGPHWLITQEADYNWRPSAPVQSFALSAMTASFTIDLSKADAQSSMSSSPDVNRVNIPNFSQENIFLFPNFQLQILTNGYLTHQFWPVSSDELVMITTIYSETKPSSYREQFAATYIQTSARDLVTEDNAVCRLQQKGLHSGGAEYIYFGENELLLRHFSDSIEKALQR